MRGNSVLFPAALGTYGDATRNIFRDSGFRNWDLSVTKNWKFKERYDAQFRAEFFNVLNHPQLFSNILPQKGHSSTNVPSAANFGCTRGLMNQTGNQSGRRRAPRHPVGFLKLIF